METTREQVLDYLAEVKDPEIPVLDVVEMGIVRDARLEGDTLHVDITPTYSGCPAMRAIEEEIVRTLRAKGFENVVVHTVFREAWTTDWMTEEAKRKLEKYGIAPPPKTDDALWLALPFATQPKPVRCPFCGSEDTERTSEFGSTACKSLHFCRACRQPFEHFKCI